MTEEKFLSEHAVTWRSLENYCLQINKHGFKSLSTTDIKNFLNEFKLASHHLAYAKTHYTDSQTIQYLNNLVSQCNTCVYASPQSKPSAYLHSLFSTYNKTLQKYKNYILFSFGIFMFAALLSFIMVLVNPESATLFLDRSIVNNAMESGHDHTLNSWNYGLISATIMQNNIRVALMAFVLGITLGIGTCWIIFSNGLILGSLTALYYIYGDPVWYWSLILPHGFTELTAIFIAGGAGLIIAKSLLIPGNLSRQHSLIKGTREALTLMGGVIVLLIIAGLIEGFFTPLNISVVIKLLFAFTTAVLLGIYMLRPYLSKESNH